MGLGEKIFLMIKLQVKEMLADTGSRDNGAKLRALILDALTKHITVEVDFTDTLMTPSFADEAIGLLANHITLDELKQKIKFSHVSAQHKALLLKVIANRFNHTKV